jgi:hypothetical protein
MSNKTNQKKNKQQPQQQQQQQQNQKKSQDKKKQKRSSEKSSSALPWIFGTFLVIGAISGILIYDTNQHGGKFEKTTVGKVMKDAGVLPYAEKGYLATMKYSARGYKWGQKNLPVYYNTTVTVLGPYAEIARDLGKIALNGGRNAWAATVTYIDTKRPTIVKFIEQYAPGLPEKTSSLCCSTWTNVKTIAINTYNVAIDFFKTKVFVGSLSPENLGKLLNNTTKSMSFYCDRFHKNIDYYAKLK